MRGKCLCQSTGRKRAELEERKKRIEELLSHSNLGKKYSRAIFENFQIRQGTEDAFFAARRYMEEWPKRKLSGEGLIIYGPPGNGKSHLAAAITHGIVERHLNSVLFANVPELLVDIMSSFEKKEETDKIRKRLHECDLLVLDDIGTERWSQWVEQIMYVVINKRLNDEKPLVLTTNCTPKELAETVGTKIWSRLQGACLLVENAGTDYRKEQAKERLRGQKNEAG